MDRRLGHMLIGPPGSGKSTLAQHMQVWLPHSCLVSTDQIRQDLYGDAAEQGAWPAIEAEVVRQMAQAIEKGQTVIYDATNTQRLWRIAFLQRLQPLGMAWIGWHLTTPLAICQQRNRQRSRQVPAPVITTCYEALQRCPPLVSDGFWAIYAVDDQTPDRQVAAYLQQAQRGMLF
jgi:predicted kinase